MPIEWILGLLVFGGLCFGAGALWYRERQYRGLRNTDKGTK